MSPSGREAAAPAATFAVIVALGVERTAFRALAERDPPLGIIQSGPGPERAASAATAALAAGASGLVSFGLAGALRAELAPGAVLVPRRVRSIAGASFEADSEWHAALTGAVRDIGLAPELDDLLTVPSALTTAAEKAKAAAGGAAAADMESAAIADRRGSRRRAFRCVARRRRRRGRRAPRGRRALDRRARRAADRRRGCRRASSRTVARALDSRSALSGGAPHARAARADRIRQPIRLRRAGRAPRRVVGALVSVADSIGDRLARVVGAILRWRKLAIVVLLAGAVASVWYAAHHLGVNTDTTTMISPELAWRQNFNEYREAFPARDRNLLIVIDARTPTRADAFAAKNARRAAPRARSLSLDLAARRGRVLRAQRPLVLAARAARAALGPAHGRAAAPGAAACALRRRGGARRRGTHTRAGSRAGRRRCRGCAALHRAHARARRGAHGGAGAARLGQADLDRRRAAAEPAAAHRAPALRRLRQDPTGESRDRRGSRDRRAPRTRPRPSP